MRIFTKLRELFNKLNKFLIIKTVKKTDIESLIQEITELSYQTTFLSTVSHELRTPLAIIKECIYLITDEVKGPLTPEQKQIMLIAEKNYLRLDKLVTDLVLMSEIESNRIKLVYADLNIKEFISSICAKYKKVAEGKKIIIKTLFQSPETPLMVELDKLKMEIVFNNIISNSIRFIKDGGSVQIMLNDLPNCVEIRLQDIGNSPTPKNVNLLLEIFRQDGRSPRSGYQGLGLGLPISKGIVMMHKGTLEINTISEKGIEVVVTLPKRKN